MYNFIDTLLSSTNLFTYNSNDASSSRDIGKKLVPAFSKVQGSIPGICLDFHVLKSVRRRMRRRRRP